MCTWSLQLLDTMCHQHATHYAMREQQMCLKRFLYLCLPLSSRGHVCYCAGVSNAQACSGRGAEGGAEDCQCVHHSTCGR